MTRVLSLASCDSAVTRPLVDGRMGVDGCALRSFRLPLNEILQRAYGGAEFDLVELGLGSYARSLGGGHCPYIALPVFPLRTFRHRDVYVYRDRVAAPRDLAGGRIGLIDYGMTAAVALRALMRKEFGLDTAAMTWVVGGVDTPLTQHPEPVEGASIETAPPGETLSRLLAEGEVDAVIALQPPACFRAGCPEVARLFPDYRRVETAYFSATGFFPIMHVIAMRRTLAAEPGLARAVYRSFLAAKNYAMAELGVTQAAKITLPWLAAAYDESRRILGPDYWSYGVAANRDQLSSFLDATHQDRLTPRTLAMDEFFHPDLIET